MKGIRKSEKRKDILENEKQAKLKPREKKLKKERKVNRYSVKGI